MLIGEGDRIPADGVLVAGDVLSVDESLLKGESAPVIRQAATVDKADQEVFAGTLVVRGGAKARVEQTGPRTRFGMIGASLSCGHEELTPLQATTRRLVFYLAIAALLFSSVVFGLYGLMRGDWLQGALTALTVAIALLPEEFPMVLAVFLALGSWRLARHNVLVRRSAVIEALGAATILCVDKTGTLTRNRMTLARAWVDGVLHDLQSQATDCGVQSLLKIAALASAPNAIDPMDRAVLQQVPASKQADEPVQTWPLQPERLAVIQL